jgi:beta-glucanase (GH16 family)
LTKEVIIKTQSSNSMNFLTWNSLAVVATVLVVFTYGQTCTAQQKRGWTLTLDDEFNESNVDNLFSSTGLWNSGQPWGQGNAIAGTNGGTYNSPVPAWSNLPAGCQQPTINTAFPSPGILTLTARNDPGNYEDWTWPGGVFTPSCDPYTYTGAEMVSKQTFLYGYFEIQAEIPNNGMVLWPAFWLWNGGGDTYREIDIFEFGSTSQSNLIWMNEHIARALDNGYVQPNPWIDANGHVINNYPGTYQIPQTDDITNNFHTYALKWTPNSITWYFDDQPVYLLAGHSPHSDMWLLADMWVQPPAWSGVDPDNWTPPWGGGPIDLLPANFDIDYIRAYKSQTNEFMYQWGNGGSGQIGGWSTKDRYISGRFEGNGKAQLLGISDAESAEMMDFNVSSWVTAWSNKFGFPNWVLIRDDKYIVGDFAGLGRDQVLAINDDDGQAQLMSYSASSKSWNTPWSTGGGKIAWWYMHKEDQYIAGDFAGLGFDQLLAINYADGWAQLMEYYGGSWHMIWTNSGNHWISAWYLSAGDKYLSGNFQGNVNGQKGLLAIATNGDGYAGLLKYANGTWQNVWDNQGTGKIHWWNMNPTDNYLVGNFDGGNQDQLMAVAANGDGWTQLMSFSGSDWDTPWSNDGGGTIDYWYMNSSDKYIAGDFNGHLQTDLFAVATNGWAQLMQRTLPSP